MNDCRAFILMKMIGLVSLFNGILTLMGHLIPKPSLYKKQLWYYLTHSWKDKGVNTFPKSISLKVNEMARIEFELADFGSTAKGPIH